MFTLKYNVLGKVGVLHMPEVSQNNPDKNTVTPEKTESDFSKLKNAKSLDEQKAILKDMTVPQRKAIQNHIAELGKKDPNPSKVTNAWRASISAEISTLNQSVSTPDPKIIGNVDLSKGLPVSKEVPSSTGTENSSDAILPDDISNIIANHTEKVDKVQKGTVEKIDGLKVDILMTKIFNLPDNFFKGEITRVSKFQELMKVTASLLSGSDVPKTEKDWAKLGYSGQNVFTWGDKAELAVLNDFLATVKADPDKASLVKDIVSLAGNSEQGYKKVLHDRANLLSRAANDTVTPLTLGKKGEIQNENTDRVDALLGEDGWDTFGGKGTIEVSLKSAITKPGQSLDSVYARITGQTAPNWNSKGEIVTARMNFHDALAARLAIIKAIGGANAGLDAVLQGKDAAYIKNIKDYVEKNGEIQTQPLDKNIIGGLSDTWVNSLSGVLGVAVAVSTQGMITLRARGVDTLKSENLLQELAKDPKLEGADKGALKWIANFFVGRRFSLDLGNGTAHDALKQRLINAAKNIQNITKDTDPATITDLGLKNAFSYAKGIGLLDTPEGVKKFQNAILQKAIVDNGSAEKDSVQYWASLNPIFLGLHRDGVSLKTIATKESNANALEAEATTDKVSLDKLGIRVEGGKIFTIPSTISDGVINNVPVFITAEDGTRTPLTGPLTKTFNTPQSLKLTRITNQEQPIYVVSFREATAVSTTADVTKKSTVDNSADITNAVSLTTGRESFKNVSLAGSIYMMARTHGKYKYFDKALEQAGNQNYTEALSTLKNAKNSKVAQALYIKYKNDPEGLAVALTYKYGGVEKLAHADKFTKAQYAKSREAAVIKAENKLAGSNPTTNEMEKEFKNLPSHKATELNTLLPGQALAVSVYATPKGGAHTIDKFEGSIQVSQYTPDITSAKAKGEIFDRYAKTTNIKQLDALNKGLTDDKKLTMDEFRSLVVDGKVPAKLEGINIIKPAQFKEARAMIQGNLCTNKVEVIAYPVITGQTEPVVQNVDVADRGLTTVLPDTSVTDTESDFGGNPVAIAEKFKPKPKPKQETPQGKQNSVTDGNKTSVDPSKEPTGIHTDAPSVSVGPKAPPPIQQAPTQTVTQAPTQTVTQAPTTSTIIPVDPDA